MDLQSLEQKLEYDYQHLNPNRPEINDIPDTHLSEGVATLGTQRVVYRLIVTTIGAIFKVVVEVPGILVRERYRSEFNQDYSIIKLLNDGLKPALERTMWFELTKMSGIVLSDECVEFHYWQNSDAALYGKRPQQHE